MNTGQMLLSLGALILLSLITLRVISTQFYTQTILRNTKFGVIAVSVATSIMEEASEKAFDEKSVEDFVGSLNLLTSRTNFGTESGENANNSDTFDDFDDFDEYAKSVIDTTLSSVAFNVNCSVNYINPDIEGLTTTSRTWHKQLIITVTSSSMVDTIQMIKVFSYWKFP